MPVVKMEISVRTYRMIQSGMLNLTHRGLRDIHGQIVELGKFVGFSKVQETTNPVVDVGNRLLQQNKAIAKKTDQLIKVSNTVVNKLDVMQNSMQGMNMIAYANVGLSCVNIATNVIGDVVILVKLNKMQSELDEIMQSSKEIYEKVKNIEDRMISKTFAEYQKLHNKLDNAIVRMTNNEITNADQLSSIYDLLVETSAFIQEMKINFIKIDAEDCNPTYLLNLVSKYAIVAGLYVTTFANVHDQDERVLEDSAVVALKQPLVEILSEQMKDKMYEYFYVHTEGLPLEEELNNMVTLPLLTFQIISKQLDCIIDSSKIKSTPDTQVEVYLDEEDIQLLQQNNHPINLEKVLS